MGLVSKFIKKKMKSPLDKNQPVIYGAYWNGDIVVLFFIQNSS